MRLVVYGLGYRHGTYAHFLTGGTNHTDPQLAPRVAGRVHRRSRVRTSDAYCETAALVQSSAAGEEFCGLNATSRRIEPI